MNKEVKFLKGKLEDLPKNREENTFYFCEDSGELYFNSWKLKGNKQTN